MVRNLSTNQPSKNLFLSFFYQRLSPILLTLTLILTGCGGSTGDTATYMVEVTVSGLPAGDSIILQNNGGDDLSVTVDGAATFNSSQADDSAYHVTVMTQPTDSSKLCAATNPLGAINGAAATVTVSCSDVVILSGTTEDSVSNGTLGTIPIEVRNAIDDSVLSTSASQTAINNGTHGHYSITAPSGFDIYLHSDFHDIEGTNYLATDLQIINETTARRNIKFYLVDEATAASVGTTIGADATNDAIFSLDVEDIVGSIAGVTATTAPAVTSLLYNQDATMTNFIVTAPTTTNSPSILGYLAAPATPTTVTFSLAPDNSTAGYTIDTTFDLKLIAGEISSPIDGTVTDYAVELTAADEDFVDFGTFTGFMNNSDWAVIEKVKIPAGSAGGWHMFRGKGWVDQEGDIAIQLQSNVALNQVSVWVRESNIWNQLYMSKDDVAGLEILDDTWYTICLQYNAATTTLGLYVNGNFITSIPLPLVDDSANSNKLFFGGQDVDPWRNEGALYSEANATIANQAWFQRLLTPAEIAAYDGSVDISDPDLFFSTEITDTTVLDTQVLRDGTNGNTPQYVVY